MSAPRRRAPLRGFSLLELLLAVVIAALLASIALPSYASYAARARRVAGRGALVQLAHWLERVATVSGGYPDRVDIPSGLLQSEGGHYRLDAVTTPTTFTLLAVPAGAQTSDRCGTLGLLQSGERTISNVTSDATVDVCWNR
ncbi:prepilin-type N-terminal cleavage/methylation domain-containing protein [Xylophilus sp. Kf1]|nr:prepilin-type N-terminal cleavage/methylation domain-containing protein [Xylophilus sp. Kf1]